jgi:hypothetical protein
LTIDTKEVTESRKLKTDRQDTGQKKKKGQNRRRTDKTMVKRKKRDKIEDGQTREWSKEKKGQKNKL